MIVATAALAIDTFVDGSADDERKAAAIEAADVMAQYLPQAWDVLTGHPEMPAAILQQVASQPKLLQ